MTKARQLGLKPKNVLGDHSIQIIKDLGLPPFAFCIVGGAAMQLYGLRGNLNDVDLLCTDDLYGLCKMSGDWVECKMSENGERLTLRKEDSPIPIELLPLSHFEENRTVSKLYIDDANLIDGVHVIKRKYLLLWKQEAHTDPTRDPHKDADDIKLLTEYFARLRPR